MSIESSIRSRGGFAKACELRGLGHSPHAVRAATASGAIVRVRKGWYANPDMPADALRAFRVGGVLSCVSAAVHHGLWVPEHEGLHLAVPRCASRLRTADDFRVRLTTRPDPLVIVHWMRGEPSAGRLAVPVSESVRQTFQCQGRTDGFIVFESALRKGKLDTLERHELIDSLAKSDRPVARLSSAASDSGTESIVKLWLHGAGIPFVQQFMVPVAGPVDFLVGTRLVVEVDSRTFHSDPYRDRRKDAELSIRGFRVLRFMYSQIIYEWPLVEASIRAAILRGDHLEG